MVDYPEYPVVEEVKHIIETHELFPSNRYEVTLDFPSFLQDIDEGTKILPLKKVVIVVSSSTVLDSNNYLGDNHGESETDSQFGYNVRQPVEFAVFANHKADADRTGIKLMNTILKDSAKFADRGLIVDFSGGSIGSFEVVPGIFSVVISMNILWVLVHGYPED